jgi:glucose-1-phosphate cytidylyltransferase
MLDVDNSGRVREFVEKPQVDGWASAGYIILNRRIFDYLGRVDIHPGVNARGFLRLTT